nr:ATP-binding protein [Alphaproteobacteria bacterium]
THQIFSLAGIWFAALEDGDTLIIDELDNHLHPHALKALVGLFYSPKTNPNNAQLIFTGHTTSIMQADFMHRDNILFFEKTKKESTEFIPLSDYKLRSSDNFQKAYLQGRYGGVPYVKEFINATTE